MKKIKVLFQHPALAHYRTELFRHLFKCPWLDITLVLNRTKTLYPGANQSFDEYPAIVLHTETNLKWRRELFRLQMTCDCDCIIATLPLSQPGLMSLVATRLRSTALIFFTESWYASGNTSANKHPLLHRLKNMVYKFVVRRADALVVPGQSARDFHEKLGVPKKCIFVANQSSRDLSRSFPVYEKPPSVDSQAFTLLYSSRLLKLKGPDVLLKAFVEVEKTRTDIKLVMVGDGPFLNQCRQMKKEFNLKNVDIVGAVSNEKVGVYFATADAFVLANTGIPYPDAWGLVINEAASMSLPIICTRWAGAVADMVLDGENGFIFEPGNPHSLSMAIIELFSDRHRLMQMGRRSREMFESFNSYDKMAKGFVKAIMFATDK